VGWAWAAFLSPRPLRKATSMGMGMGMAKLAGSGLLPRGGPGGGDHHHDDHSTALANSQL
jgi:hypothetical protein